MNDSFNFCFENVKIIFNNSLVKSEQKANYESRYSIKFVVTKDDPVFVEWRTKISAYKDRIDLKDYTRNQNAAQVKLIRPEDELPSTASATQRFLSQHYANQYIISASTGKGGSTPPQVYDHNFLLIDRTNQDVLDEYKLHDSPESKEIFIGDVSLTTFVRPKGDSKGAIHLSFSYVMLSHRETVSPGIQGGASDARFFEKMHAAQAANKEARKAQLKAQAQTPTSPEDAAMLWADVEEEAAVVTKTKPAGLRKSKATVIPDEDF